MAGFMSKVEISLTLDIGKLQTVVETAKDLNDNPAVFKELAKIAAAVEEVEGVLAQVEEVGNQAKEVIDQKAQSIDPNWSVIKGAGYKINRKPYGDVFIITDEAKAKAFLKKPKPKVDTGKVKEYRELNSKLPDGIEDNPKRGKTITIKTEAV